MIEGVQVVDKAWRYLYVNDALVEQSKYSKEDLLGCTMMERYSGIEQSEMFKVLKKCMTRREFCQMENEFKFPDESSGWFELRMEPVDEGVLIMSFDITDRKQMEMQLRQFNEHLEDMVNERTRELVDALEREKILNELKSRFVSIASHEFKMPLGAIQISVNVLEEYNGPEYTDRRTEYHHHIRSSVSNMFEIIDDFLALDKLEHGSVESERKKVDLPKLLREEVKKMQLICKENQKISLAYNGDKFGTVDDKIISRILMNLLSNAIKYSDRDVQIAAEVNSQSIKLSVIDKGIGVPEEEQSKLFDKFFRARNAREIQGTGLGLNIVKRYVDMLGGTIDFSSSTDGSDFRVSLPNAGFLKVKTRSELI